MGCNNCICDKNQEEVLDIDTNYNKAGAITSRVTKK